MLEKVKTFLSQWLPFANQAIKREREPAADEPVVNEPSPLNHHAPFSKKLRLMPGLNLDGEHHNNRPMPSKSELENREPGTLKWSEFLKNKSLHTSTPMAGNPTEPRRSKSHAMKTTEVSEASHGVKTMHLVLDTVEDGTSLKQLEKLSKLGSADLDCPSTLTKKPEATNMFAIPEPTTSSFSFAPLISSNPSTSSDRSEKLTRNNQALPSVEPSTSSSRFGKLLPENIKRRTTPNGGIHKYKPVHQKLFGSTRKPKTQALFTSILANPSSKWAFNSCIRMEERQSYQALLAQFAPKPMDRLSQAVSPSSTRSQTPVPGVFIEQLDSKESQSIKQQLKKRPSIVSQVVDLENEPSCVSRANIDMAASPLSLRSPARQPPSITRVNTLEEALALSPQYDAHFVADLKSRYSARERERKRQMAEEEVRSRVLAENREGWEGELEQRLRKQLEVLSVKPVLDEREAEAAPLLPELSDEMVRVIDRCLNGGSEGEVLCDAFSLTITRRDVKTLAGLNWLNDQVINFYLTLIMERSKTGDWPKVFAHNTFFYPKLMSSGHAGLKRWTRRVDLFQQDFILVPVHLGLHWCLAIVAPKEQTIRYYDSMGGKNFDCLKALKQYMEDESMDKRKTKLDTSNWSLDCVQDIPQQMNGSDCGMFACKYAEYAARRARITFDQKDMPYFRRRMVYEIVTRELIHP